jgi:phosphopentomutase
VNLGTRRSYADVGATIAEIFSLEPPQIGTSFLDKIL